MKKPRFLAIWILQTRAPFLLLSAVLVFLGAALARRSVSLSITDITIVLAGVILAHISVNLFNELSDYKTKIDENTVKTPFSGGSGMMQAGFTAPVHVEYAAWMSMFLAGAAGIYFCVTSTWWILLYMAAGAAAIRFYTTHLAKWLMGEWAAGFTLGFLVVLGVFHALTGHITLEAAYIAIPPGILTSLLLLLNELPDIRADKKGGRNHLIIRLGHVKGVRLYGILMFILFGLIGFAPLLAGAPKMVWLALLMLPFAYISFRLASKYYNNIEKLIPGLGINVAVVILTDILLAVGYLV